MDFALVGGLLTLFFVAILQLGLALHVRNVLVDCASEGARLGALADRDPQAGAARTRELIRSELSDRYANRVSAGPARVDGLDTVRGATAGDRPVRNRPDPDRVRQRDRPAGTVVPPRLSSSRSGCCC